MSIYQKFWNFFRSIFQYMADSCERMQGPAEEKTEKHIHAENMAEMLQENVRMARIKQLIGKEVLSIADEHELSDLTENEEIIVRE